MKSLIRIAISSASIVSLSAAVHAHPGHGEVGSLHYVTSPEHLLTLVAGLVGVVLIAWAVARFARTQAGI